MVAAWLRGRGRQTCWVVAALSAPQGYGRTDSPEVLGAGETLATGKGPRAQPRKGARSGEAARLERTGRHWRPRDGMLTRGPLVAGRWRTGGSHVAPNLCPMAGCPGVNIAASPAWQGDPVARGDELSSVKPQTPFRPSIGNSRGDGWRPA